ncbi:surfeit locus 1 family protein [Poseidonocella pacifica]|uniref:SURF1-like protein n=1 Tax=Poseidonocella pacifica TaxID=871651 RepID=A0A1I0WAU9_9RHOB|nr:SURF1 family protein [Poseidonocella pacifica]SFA85724.1 surfeit locus 1 family protein [Poseidonocella pacifica]
MRRLIIPLIFGLVGVAILVSLGMWQVQRLAWKQGVLAEIEARIYDDPEPLPDQPNVQDHRYQPVALRGTLGAREARVLVSVKSVGPGYRIISPFETEDGRRILLDRGFVRAAQKDAPRYSGPLSVSGNLHWPDDRNSSTPENDVEDNTWFARDIDQLAERFDTEDVLVVAREASEDTSVTPLPVDTAGIPNDHLQYVVTWFGLAAVWFAMSCYLLWRLARKET